MYFRQEKPEIFTEFLSLFDSQKGGHPIKTDAGNERQSHKNSSLSENCEDVEKKAIFRFLSVPPGHLFFFALAKLKHEG